MYESDTQNQVPAAKAEQRTMHLEAKIDEIVAKKKEIREESWAKERADDLSNTQRVWEPHEVHGDPPGTVNLTDSMVTPALFGDG